MSLRLVFFGNGPRGAACLKRLHDAGHRICAVVVHPGESNSSRAVRAAACECNAECLSPNDPNEFAFISLLRVHNADVNVLAGYSPIVSSSLISSARVMTINTHAGELPAMRGSSPLNWALIEGRTSVTLSVIQVTPVVDGGDVLAERSCTIDESTTIADLQDFANEQFPEMLVETINAIEQGNLRRRAQTNECSAYYPLRFPDDGLVLWDQLTAAQVHNRIRALTDPYPGAFSFCRGRRVRLLQSELTRTPYLGEPGRIYRKTSRGLLICASDQCLWVTRAIDERSGSSAADFVERYDRFATMREAAMRFYESGVSA